MTATLESKVGQRHVQGRTKAGGQSQQRFARRRDNQARQAYEAAAEHAVRILGQQPLTVVAGGDHPAVDEVLADPRLARVTVVEPWLPVPDPRRAVLDQAVQDACSARIEVWNAEPRVRLTLDALLDVRTGADHGTANLPADAEDADGAPRR